MRDWSPVPAPAGSPVPLQAAWRVWPLACPRRRKIATCFALRIQPTNSWICWVKRPWADSCPITEGISARHWIRAGFAVDGQVTSCGHQRILGRTWMFLASLPGAVPHWEKEIQGFYAGPHTVAEMKRTNRDKDWPFVTALGARMIEMGDERGWLHIYDETLLRKTIC